MPDVFVESTAMYNNVVLESNSANFLNEEDFHNDEDEESWIVNGLNVIQECRDYRYDCFAKRAPEQLDDVGILTMNHVYLLAEAPPCSFTRCFENMNNHHAIVLGLGISDKFILSSPETYGWCATCASRSYATWRDAQATDMFVFTSIQLLVETQSNVLHQVLPMMKIVGYTGKRGENSFVHDLLGPLLNIVYSCNVNLNHCWANVNLSSEWPNYKPDFSVFVNGLSSRFIVLVAEFKPEEARQRQESDLIKTGKQMKTMLNELIEIGVADPWCAASA
ncbi:unnamed protein product [Mucor circinelloides]